MKYIIFVVRAEAVSMEHNTPHSRSAAAHSFSLVPLLAKSERGRHRTTPLATASALFQFVLGSAEKDASSRTVHLSNGGEKV